VAAASASGFRTGFGLLLLRLLVGWVFLSEGKQKFLYPAALGAGSLSFDRRRRISSRYARPRVSESASQQVSAAALLQDFVGSRTSEAGRRSYSGGFARAKR
jgi:hypothetical protein